MSANTQNSNGRYRPLLDTAVLEQNSHINPTRIEAAYSGDVRRQLNDLGNTAFVRSANAVELKGGVTSNAAEFLSTVAGATPIIGDSLSAVFKLAGMAAKKVEENQDRELVERIAEVSSCDQNQWNVFTKTISRELAAERELDSSSREDALKLSKRDLQKIKTIFVEREIPRFSNQEGLSNEDAVREAVDAVKTVILHPNDQTIPLRKDKNPPQKNYQTSKAFEQATEVVKSLQDSNKETAPTTSHKNETWKDRIEHQTPPNQNSRGG